MAFVTFVLLMGYAKAIGEIESNNSSNSNNSYNNSNSFSPEMLGITSTTTLLVLLMEVLAYKFAFYLIASDDSGNNNNSNGSNKHDAAVISVTPSFIDLSAYCSYKYVCWIVTVVCGLLFGRQLYWCVLLLLSLSSAMFIMRTLGRSLIVRSNNNINGNQSSNGYNDNNGNNNSDNSGNTGVTRRTGFLLISGGMQVVLTVLMLRKVV